jgi:hypothetical protein
MTTTDTTDALTIQLVVRSGAFTDIHTLDTTSTSDGQCRLCSARGLISVVVWPRYVRNMPCPACHLHDYIRHAARIRPIDELLHFDTYSTGRQGGSPCLPDSTAHDRTETQEGAR